MGQSLMTCILHPNRVIIIVCSRAMRTRRYRTPSVEISRVLGSSRMMVLTCAAICEKVVLGTAIGVVIQVQAGWRLTRQELLLVGQLHRAKTSVPTSQEAA